MNWNLKRTTAPSSSPVTVSDVKKQTNINFTDDDEYLSKLISRAVSTIEGPHGVGVLLGSQTWELALDAFPSVIEVPLFPLISVDSITYVDVDGAEQTVDASVYRVDTHSNPPRISLEYGQAWPTARRVANTATVTFTGGHTAIPEDLQHAVILLVAHWYEDREGATAVPPAVESLLSRYRVPGVA